MPQPRRDVPDRFVRPLKAAAELARTAHAQRDKLIGDALKAGAGLRPVAEMVGLTDSTVLRIGHAQGWPTDTQRAEWEADRERVRQMRAMWDLPLDRQIDLQRIISDYLEGSSDDG